MRFTWDQGNGSFGQIDPRVPRQVNTYQGAPMGSMPMGGMAGGGYTYGSPRGRMAPGAMQPGVMQPGGMMQGGMPQGGMQPGGMSYGGSFAGGPSMPGGMPSMGVPPMGRPLMGMPPMGMPSSGGSIRNNLGSELKKRGVFQKDGQIKNLRGGFFGPKSQKPMTQPQGGGSMVGPFSFLGSGGGVGAGMQPRQLVLEAAQAGINANGIASISSDNVFSCIANLPSPTTFMGGPGTYAAYLMDGKGQSGFLAGVLRPIGNGVYQTQFRSQVPLSHYNRVVITVENPQHLGHIPQGPSVLQVKQAAGPIRFLSPVKKVGSSVWGKVSGFVQKRFGGAAAPGIVEEVVSEGGAITSGAELSSDVLPGAMPSASTGAVEATVEGAALQNLPPTESIP